MLRTLGLRYIIPLERIFKLGGNISRFASEDTGVSPLSLVNALAQYRVVQIISLRTV